ncbi:M16 family metallopeptidase [Helicobacter zhangjianzhongii]|uniref:Insulinase family protein n=1 Tax=Helicobacter zhangjianzhongii TaxID=2974574 RepID=A0ACC6FPQ8_9HELI|nr:MULTISPECIES: pitrilysin family protein [unclassified Helicobacter]MDL0079170.1 insulinase family protein [Helicobacter sp. CPD2-1]MDL0081198.1 insulinase family protein [Helicobacter sp. XJK30-2]
MSIGLGKSVLPKYEQKTLDNGLQIVVIPMDNGSGVIESDIFYKVGSRNEILGKSGIAHMLEHLSFKSTKKLQAGEFDKIVKGFGGVDNASTGFDYTRYFIKSSAEHIDTSLGLFAELMRNLSLKDEEFQPERQVVAEERRWRTDNSPLGYLYFRFFNTAFLHHSYHWTPIGFMGDILGWEIGDIREFYNAYYQPNNAVIVVAGDIEPQKVFASASKHFGAIPAAKSIPKVRIEEPEQDGYREVIVKKPTQIEWLIMGYKIPDFSHTDQIALSALAEVLSGGKSALLDSELVDKRNLASEVSASAMGLKDSGVFMIMAAGNEKVRAKTLQKEILGILERVKQGQITQEELDTAKRNMQASFVYSLEKSSSVAGLFGAFLVRDDVAPLLRYEEEFSKLTLADLTRVAQKYFVEDTLSVAILCDKKE